MNPVVPLPFPKGNNDTDTVLDGVHFNLTALQNNSYLLYPNNTLSNESNCYLVFDKYAPVYLFPNGTFVNSTSCYVSILPMGTRSYVGIGLAVVYGIMLVLSITALAKHGKQYLRATKRFYPVGRRWQWYWALFVCACGLISLFLNVDVDRYYVQELPIVITCFFWFLVCQGTTALVWEAVRHWGSWQERQYVDPDPFILKMDDRRSKIEFWLPMWFYFWTWMNFFLVIPRNWTFVELQRSPQQIENIAIPGAMDGRFKAGAFCLAVSWLTIVFSLHHSIKHYKARDRGFLSRAGGLLTNIPLRLALLIILDAALIAYQIFMSFSWKYSLFRLHGEIGVQFGWGYAPSVLIMIVQIVYAFVAPNEDKELIRQRRERGAEVDRDLGLVKQPDWWRRIKGDHIKGTLRDRIKKNVTEVGGVHGTGRRAEGEIERHLREEEAGIRLEDNPPMSANHPRADRAGARAFTTQSSPRSQAAQPTSGAQYTGRSDNHQSEALIQSAASMLFPNADRSEEEGRAQRLATLQEDAPPPPYSSTQNGRTNSTSTTVSATQPQQIRSMLDV